MIILTVLLENDLLLACFLARFVDLNLVYCSAVANSYKVNSFTAAKKVMQDYSS